MPSFKTLKSPRYCYVDGIRNVRDIGGYSTQDGKTIKQGEINARLSKEGEIRYNTKTNQVQWTTIEDYSSKLYSFSPDSSAVKVFEGSQGVWGQRPYDYNVLANSRKKARKSSPISG